MISQGHIVGLLNPEILLELEQNPSGEIAQITSLCSALEIRYDWFENETEWPSLSSRIRSIFPDKLQIGTIRLVRDGGLFDNSSATMRLKNWGQILTEEQTPDLLDLEQDCLFDFEALNALASAKDVKIFISQHNFLRIPPYPVLTTLVEDAKRVGASGVKIAAMSNAEGDSDPLYDFIQEFSKDFPYFSAFAMGNTGKPSRILSLLKGANLSYGSILESSVPGQLSVRLMHEILIKITEINDETGIRQFLNQSLL